MTDVILHGLLGKQFGEKHRFFIRKPIDAIKALDANKEGFMYALRTWGKEGRAYEIICDGKVIAWNNEFEQKGEYKQIDIVPAIVGTSDEVKTGLGIIMMVVAWWNPAGWSWLGTGGFGGMSTFGNMVFSVGMTLATQGIMGMLYPAPTPSFDSTPQAKSFMFSAMQNAQVQGPPVQVGYGRLRVGSKVISTTLRPQRLSKPRPRGTAGRTGGPVEPSPSNYTVGGYNNDDLNQILYDFWYNEQQQLQGIKRKIVGE